MNVGFRVKDLGSKRLKGVCCMDCIGQHYRDY